jgi:GntR family transcriptional regulator
MTLASGPLPKYYQLAEILRSQISAGDVKPGDQLPSEDALCRQHAVSRGTVREAVRLLVDEGVIRREHGRGTFVTEPPAKRTLFTLTSFDEDMRRQGRSPATRLITATVTPASPEVAARLTLAPDEPVFHIVRLRLADGQPVAHETRYLARSLCPELLTESLATVSIHRLLIDKYQVPMVRMTHTVEAGQLSAATAALLQARPGTPAFFVDRLTYTVRQQARRPAVWFQAVYREDTYNIGARFQASL